MIPDLIHKIWEVNGYVFNLFILPLHLFIFPLSFYYAMANIYYLLYLNKPYKLKAYRYKI